MKKTNPLVRLVGGVGAGALFSAGLIVMLVFGILACEDAVKSDYYCPAANSCNDDDDNHVTTTSKNWGPCGLGYGSSSSSTCEMYCGNQTGVVCAYMNYDCLTGKNTSSFYCSNARTHCTDTQYCSAARRACFNPTASALIFIPVVFLSLMLLSVFFNCFIFNKPLDFLTFTDPFPAFRPKDDDFMDPEADPNALASDSPKRFAELPSRNLIPVMTSDSLPEIQLEIHERQLSPPVRTRKDDLMDPEADPIALVSDVPKKFNNIAELPSRNLTPIVRSDHLPEIQLELYTQYEESRYNI